MPTLKISPKLHQRLKVYCVLKKIKLETYVSDRLSSDPDLISFESKLKRIKF